MLLKLDSVGTEYAWVRGATDTTGGNYFLTIKDAARFRPPVSTESALQSGVGIDVFPTLVKDALYMQAAFAKPVRMPVTFYTIDGKTVGRSGLDFPTGQATLSVPYPEGASGILMMDIRGDGIRKVQKLIINH